MSHMLTSDVPVFGDRRKPVEPLGHGSAQIYNAWDGEG
jgi:hypothetical protein